MKRIKIHTVANWLKRQVSSSPNRQIIATGSVVAVAFFVLANLLNGIWSSLFVNLTAGVVIVILTVVLVDMLRTYHANKQFSVPRAKAIEQIRSANFGLLNNHMIYSKSIDYLRKFYAATRQMTADDSTPLGKVIDEYAIHLSKSNNILSGFSKEKIQSLGKALSKAADSLEKTRQRYDYSFSDIDFKNDVVSLVDKADASLSVFEISNYDTSLLNQVIVPIDKSKPKLSGDEGLQSFVGAMFSDYIKTYVEFGEKYFKS